MTSDSKKKRFLNLPQYIGGSEAFKSFVSTNLKYPAEALNDKIEGSVIVEYDISDEGVVINPRILKGLGHGCDEEAIRVVSLLIYEKVRNRGLRVKVTTKTTIHFKLPGISINYTIPSKNQIKTEEKISPTGTYEYKIQW